MKRTKFIYYIAILLTFISCNGNTNNTIEIGAILPLTGSGAIAGEYSLKGIELAVEEYNQNNNKNIELLVADSKSTSKDAVFAYNKLNSNKKIEVIYSQLSNVSPVIKPFTEQHKQVHFVVSGSEDILNDSQYVIRNYSDPNDVAFTAINFIKDSLNVANFNVLYPNNEFGLSIKSTIEAKMHESQQGKVSTIPYEENNIDQNLIIKAISEQPQAIYIVGLGKPLGLIIKQLRIRGYTGNIIGGLETPFADVKAVAGESIKDVYYVSFNYDVAKCGKSFNEKFKAKYSSEPQAPSLVAYSAVKIMLENNCNIDSLKGKEFITPLGVVEIINNNIKYPLVIGQIK